MTKFYNHGKLFKISLNAKIHEITPGENNIDGLDGIIVPMVQNSHILSFGPEAPTKELEPKKAEPKKVVEKVAPKKVVKKASLKKIIKKRK